MVFTTVNDARSTSEMAPSWPTAARNPSGASEMELGGFGRAMTTLLLPAGSYTWIELGSFAAMTMRSSALLYSASTTLKLSMVSVSFTQLPPAQRLPVPHDVPHAPQ